MVTHTVVVGAGAAGVPLAARLSEDPSRRVTLLEAGALTKTPDDLIDGGTLAGAHPAHPAIWKYPTMLREAHPGDITRGKILGGSTAVNGGYFVRATREDFKRWASVAGPEWAYEQVLPLLKSLEHDLNYAGTPTHGDAGPMQIVRPPVDTPVASRFIAASLSLGFPLESDKNSGGLPGVGPVPSNIVEGTRRNTFLAYDEAYGLTSRENLTIKTGTTAHRVLLDDAHRVHGVETNTGVIAADEVVLTAGAIETPKLLMLSGIGPAEELARHNIPQLVDLPLGSSFNDHPNIALEWKSTVPLTDWDAGSAFPVALNTGNLEILVAAKPLRFLLEGIKDAGTTHHLLIADQGYSGTGRISLQSADPSDAPVIEYRYFSDPTSLSTMREGIRIAAQILESTAFTDVFSHVTDLSRETLESDNLLDTWILERHGTALHTCGSAPIGPVVDGTGRVHGVQGLRVADTSILPTTPSRGPAATAVFLGEFIARRMLAK